MDLLCKVDVRMKDGSLGKLLIVDPGKLIPHLVEHSPEFAALAERAILAHPVDHVFS